METINLEEIEIPGAVLSREVDESGTAIITLRMVEDVERGRYEVKEWMASSWLSRSTTWERHLLSIKQV